LFLFYKRPQNFIGQSQSGTGKTAAFLIGGLTAIDVNKKCTQAICLAPTRELASQIYDDAVIFSKYASISVYWINKSCSEQGLFG
jgi:ATP-dependent RNA helicase DDX19/DBP5